MPTSILKMAAVCPESMHLVADKREHADRLQGSMKMAYEESTLLQKLKEYGIDVRAATEFDRLRQEGE